VVGASLGGIAILLAAARAKAFPFAACVLVDITPRVRPEGVAEILGFMTDSLEDGFESVEAAADAVARYLPHRPRPVEAKGLGRNLRRGRDGRYRWHWDPRFVTGPLSVQDSADEEARIRAARCLTAPTLLVRGGLSNLVTEADSAHFVSLVPGSRLVDVSDAGHMVAGDRNDAFTAAILGFLEEVRAGAA
jgi:pimeloyl-ACP methyl ester carboxylesterase